MVTTELGACEWFVWDLRRSNLIDREQLDHMVHEFLQQHTGAEPPALADCLVKNGLLTQFQCERLLQGKTQGFVLGPFTLLDVLGTGSLGTVYKARSKSDSGTYAVKVLPRRSMWNVRIARRKVKSFDLCSHPAVVPFVDVGTSGGMHYLAWPFIEGETLEHRTVSKSRLEAGEVARIAHQLAEGLASCHPHGLVHGLLKPSNLMLTESEDIRILDFGIGCLLAEADGESIVDTMSTANSVSNGLDCSSPESIMDPTNISPAGDQYSLGCIMYYCLSGRYPFPDGTAVEKMMAQQTKKPTPLAQLNPDVPAGLITVVERLMAKKPEDRYPDAAAAAAALKPFVVELSGDHARRAEASRQSAAMRDSAKGPGSSIRDTVHNASYLTPAPRQSRSLPTPNRGAVPTDPAASPKGPPSPAGLPTRQSLRGSGERAPAAPQRPSMVRRAVPRLRRDSLFSPFSATMLVVLVALVVWLLGRTFLFHIH
jgi:serine/threonine-protein kinase